MCKLVNVKQTSEHQLLSGRVSIHFEFGGGGGGGGSLVTDGLTFYLLYMYCRTIEKEERDRDGEIKFRRGFFSVKTKRDIYGVFVVRGY